MTRQPRGHCSPFENVLAHKLKKKKNFGEKELQELPGFTCIIFFLLHFAALQNEVSLLRNEVAHLKQLLLAHKDCPVTTLQKKTAYLGEPS